MNKKQWLIPALAMTIVGGSLAGVSLTKSYAASPAAKASQTEESSKEDAAVLQQAKISKADSEAIALKAVPGTLKTSELENEDGQAVYGVQIADQSGKVKDVKVDAKTGKVLKAGADDQENEKKGEKSDKEAEKSENQADLAKQAVISKADSEAIALKAVPGTVQSSELEDENGTVVYGVQVVGKDGKKSDVKIDAKTGKVVKAEADDNEKEQNNKENDGEQANQ